MSTLQSSDASTYPRLSDDFRQKYTVDARDLMLYHGSMVPGIREFRQAQNCTFGKGIYCTSQRDKAAGYACVRASGNHDVDFDPVNYPKPDDLSF